MLYREIIAVCSEIHRKHINTMREQNVEFLNVKLVVHIVTTGSCSVNLFTYRFQTERWTQRSGDKVSCSQGCIIVIVCVSNYELRRPHQASVLRIHGVTREETRQLHKVLYCVNKGLQHRPCHGAGGQLPASDRGDLGSIPSHSVCSFCSHQKTVGNTKLPSDSS